MSPSHHRHHGMERGLKRAELYPSLREMKVLKGGSNKNPDFSKVAVVGIDFHGLSFVVKGGGGYHDETRRRGRCNEGRDETNALSF